MRDDGLVFCFRHGEELRRMGQHGAADHSGHHDHSPLPKKYPAPQVTTMQAAQQSRQLAALPMPGSSRYALVRWRRTGGLGPAAAGEMGQDGRRAGQDRRVSENRREIEALRQSFDEQGLANRKVEVEELFHPSTCDIAKI